MSSLYEIANDFARLMDSDMDPEMIADTLEGIEGEMEMKVENCLAIIKNELAYAEALKQESQSLTDRAKACVARTDRLKEYVAQSLQTAGRKSLKAGIHQVTVRAPVKSVEITDIDALPVELVEYQTTTKPDKLEIKKRLDAGMDVPGASIKSGKPSLIIK